MRALCNVCYRQPGSMGSIHLDGMRLGEDGGRTDRGVDWGCVCVQTSCNMNRSSNQKLFDHVRRMNPTEVPVLIRTASNDLAQVIEVPNDVFYFGLQADALIALCRTASQVGWCSRPRGCEMFRDAPRGWLCFYWLCFWFKHKIVFVLKPCEYHFGLYHHFGGLKAYQYRQLSKSYLYVQLGQALYTRLGYCSKSTKNARMKDRNLSPVK